MIVTVFTYNKHGRPKNNIYKNIINIYNENKTNRLCLQYLSNEQIQVIKLPLNITFLIQEEKNNLL